MGKMGERLMVHPASVTNAITRLEHRDRFERRLAPDDRRVVLATITPDGQALVREATEALNQASFTSRPLPGSGRRDHFGPARRSGRGRRHHPRRAQSVRIGLHAVPEHRFRCGLRCSCLDLPNDPRCALILSDFGVCMCI